MNNMIKLANIADISKHIPQIVLKHPLVAVINFAAIEDHIEEGTKICLDFYCLMFKNYCVNNMKYGRKSYDFQDGSLVCIAPNQIITLEGRVEKKEDAMGWGLFFHQDLIRGTSLEAKVKDYTFFSYDVAEALHLSEKEKQILYDCVVKIENELAENIDSHSKPLLVSNIELLLNYCSRYYGRQFITRNTAGQSTVSAVDALILNYLKSGQVEQNGLPTVKYLAEQVHLSPNYLSDLLKKETGMSAQDKIHYHLINEAKSILLNTGSSVSEIAYSLGFEYPQYFSKLFKQKTGKTPLAYRNMN
ncbi:MAG: AraC family transcriptional regulator [Chitinophagia bacterium]|nr:AraC family transcriptional regulator [Chitinophagia bacterium]